MTTPPPTAEQLIQAGLADPVPESPGGPGVAGLLPDEATLNRLAGEFFAALPGLPVGSGWPAPSSPAAPPTAAATGGVEQAPRVDVPATASGISHAPGSDRAAGSGGSAGGGVPAVRSAPAAEWGVPGIAQTDPAAAAGLAPSGSVPIHTEAADARSSANGLGAPLPENPFIQGVTGLQLAQPGDLTPGWPELSSPLPSADLPGLPASDQVMATDGVPGGSPDTTAVSSALTATPGVGPAAPGPAAPGVVTAHFGTPSAGPATPELPAVPIVPGVTGAGGPPSGFDQETLPSADLPPWSPASDRAVSGGALPGGLPNEARVTSAPDAGPLTPGTATAPFGIPPAGVSTPELPVVPPVPGVTGATGLPSGLGTDRWPTPSGYRDPAAPSELDSIGTPSIPQPPLAVPDAPAPVPTPSTPYYFVAESSPYPPEHDAGLDRLAAAALTSYLEPPDVAAAGGYGAPASLPGGYGAPASPPGVPDTLLGVPDTLPGLPGIAGGSPNSLVPAYYFLDRPGASAGAPGSGNPPTGGHRPFDVHRIRRDFPILSERVNGRPLIWLDNAATTQKPQAVLDRLAHFYRHENSNIHRAAHELAARATDAYEGARKTVARFLGAGSEKDVVFVRGATEAINLVAKSWGKANIHRGDEIVISHLEHHANIVPWQQLIGETGAVLRVIPVDDSGQILLDEYTKLLSDKTKLVAVTHVSNALGTVTPAGQIVELGHRAGACVLIDGAQSVPHLRVNMQDLGADFFVFSGHKIFAPTGIGVLYGRPEVLEAMPPWEGGGNMIADVTFEKTAYQAPPARFEAGTGNIADAVGLGAALDYVTRIGLENIAGYEHSLLEYATPRLGQVPGLHLIGTATLKASVMSFVLDGYRTEEVGAALNQEGIAVRSGHHCAQPILRRFGVQATVRPSLAFYNTRGEIDTLVAALHRLAADRGRR